MGVTPTGSPGRIEMLNGVPIHFELHGSGEPLLLQRWPEFLKTAAAFLRGLGAGYGARFSAAQRPESCKLLKIVD